MSQGRFTGVPLSFSLPVLPGHHPKHFLEFAAKIPDIFKPGVTGDFRNVALCRDKQFRRPFQPVMD